MNQNIILRQIGSCITMSGALQKQGRFPKVEDLGEIKKAALVIQSGKIVWIGEDRKLSPALKTLTAHFKGRKKGFIEYSLKNKTLLPGFIDAHTHLVFAGNRSKEFEMRNLGVSYQEIASKGGGIISTMCATRLASSAKLLKLAQGREEQALRHGITCIEIKSGYGLNLETETKQLKVAQALKKLKVVNTFLGPHALPPEFSTFSDYLDFVVKKMLPEIKKRKLATRADIFVEQGFFTANQAEAYCREVRKLGLDLVIHAEQFTSSGGIDLAVQWQAKSADHLVAASEQQITKIANSDVVAMLLPLADLYLKCPYPKARALIDQGAQVAIATDFNPGSSPTQDLSLAGILARLYMQMSLPEVLVAVTVNAAKALNKQDEVGSLSVGKSADFVITEKDWQELFYQAGESWVQETWIRGYKEFAKN